MLSLLFGTIAHAVTSSAVPQRVKVTAAGASPNLLAPCDTDGVTTDYQPTYTGGIGYMITP